MKELVSNIFKQNNFILDYELLGDSDCFFAERTKDRFDFFTVIFENLESFSVERIKEKCDEFMSIIMKNKSHHLGLDKNLSLVVFIKIDQQSDSRLNSIIHDIEEDPYDFRKYIITFTKEQQDFISDSMSQLDISEVEYLQKRVLDEQGFAAYKRGDATPLAIEYELISKLFIKLPFLNFDVILKNLQDLSMIIESTIKQEDKEIWSELMVFENQSEKEPEIEEILEYFEVLDVE